tara:strand:- start:3925 stop:4386 length:462 start_codon:yes stop_codon:yes gene_type:complete
MTSNPHWTAYIGALLVPTVALLGLLIAYRQWRTAQNKLKLELFEKRLAIYNAATAFISSVMTSGKATDPQLRDLILGTKEAKWILSSEIAKYLDEQLYAKGVDLQCLSAELEGVPVSQERSTNVHEQRNIKLWLNDQYRILDEKFAKYLSISH